VSEQPRCIRHGHGDLSRETWCGEYADPLTFADVDGALYSIVGQRPQEVCLKCVEAVQTTLASGFTDPFPKDGFGFGHVGRIRHAIKAAPERGRCRASAGPPYNATCVLLQHDERTPHEVFGLGNVHQWFTEKEWGE
jgi:hypothetical protein